MTRANPDKTTAAVDVMCAFCSGKGKDPFGILSPLATCQVCGGTGRGTLRQPTTPCPFCRGTGVYLGTRNTCTTCGGVGTVEIPDDAVTCPCCGGTGWAADDANYIWPDSPLSCGCCRGKGVVAPERQPVLADPQDSPGKE
jgi:DnaJ-class molecular chaperone